MPPPVIQYSRAEASAAGEVVCRVMFALIVARRDIDLVIAPNDGLELHATIVVRKGILHVIAHNSSSVTTTLELVTTHKSAKSTGTVSNATIVVKRVISPATAPDLAIKVAGTASITRLPASTSQ